jgi:hypothetical protein
MNETLPPIPGPVTLVALLLATSLGLTGCHGGVGVSVGVYVGDRLRVEPRLLSRAAAVARADDGSHDGEEERTAAPGNLLATDPAPPARGTDAQSP